MFINNKILFIFINKLKLKLKDKFMWRNKKEDTTLHVSKNYKDKRGKK